MAEDGSNSAWKLVLGPSKESRTFRGGGAGGSAVQAAAATRSRSTAAEKTEIGFEITHGKSRPGTRTSTR